MGNEMALSAYFTLMFMAAILDVRTRIIPDSICLLIALIGLLYREPCDMTGILAALPLLLAGMTIGGIGGGDIKITGASGMVLGFMRAVTGLLIGLLLLILFHSWLHIYEEKVRKKARQDRKEKEEQAYPLVPFLFFGMIISQFL